MKEVLSLGGGVQSSYLLIKSCLGELPRLDNVVFADTGWETDATYAYLDWLKGFAFGYGVEIDTVSMGNIRDDAMNSQVRGKVKDGRRWASMPYFITGPKGERGMIRRQCTYEYKIRPIDEYMKRTVMGIKKHKHAPKTPQIRQWFGISLDELQRQKSPEFKWKTHWYPLIEERVTRAMILDWFARRQYPTPPRSACIGCPYHSNVEWRAIKENPKHWDDVIEFDEQIRNCKGMRGKVFLHQSRQPLVQIDFRTVDEKSGQMNLWQEECEGMCGV